MLVVLLLLSIVPDNDGCCFGGQTISIKLTPTLHQIPAGPISWELSSTTATVDRGRVNMTSQNELPVEIPLPIVRTATQLRCHFLKAHPQHANVTQAGVCTLQVFPPVEYDLLQQQLTNRQVSVIARGDTLPKALRSWKLDCKHIKHPNTLALLQSDLIIVESDALSARGDWQSILLRQAEQGAGVLVLPQRGITRLFGYALIPHDDRAKLSWQKDHPIRASLTEQHLTHWTSAALNANNSIALPVDESALEIAYWKPAVTGSEPIPLDALLVEKQLGLGRLLLCQIPARPDSGDPRSVYLFHDLLAYLTTRPIPTPSPRFRRQESNPHTAERNEIPLTPGVR